MARVTVEDCLRYCKNRFHLILDAANRAHHIQVGAAEPMVSIDNDKPTVLALREIAKGFDVNAPLVDEYQAEAVSDAELADRFMGIKAGTILPDAMPELEPEFSTTPSAFTVETQSQPFPDVFLSSQIAQKAAEQAAAQQAKKEAEDDAAEPEEGAE